MQGLSFGELLDYASEETRNWQRWFTKNPAALDVPCDIAGTTKVHGLVLHIVIVQKRYAERLLNRPVTEYSALETKSAAELFALAEESAKDLRSFAVCAQDTDWDGTITFPTRTAGTLTASRRKIFVHALMHSIRHWAQLATFLRHEGYKQDWQHDFLFSSVMS